MLEVRSTLYLVVFECPSASHDDQGVYHRMELGTAGSQGSSLAAPKLAKRRVYYLAYFGLAQSATGDQPRFYTRGWFCDESCTHCS